MSAFNQLYNYKANWNNSYSTTKEISSYWNAGGAGPTTVYDYLSTNNVVIQSSTILNYLSVVGDATVLGNLTAYGDTTFVNTLVTVTTAASGEFNNLLVGSLTANEFFNINFNNLYTNLVYNSTAYLSAYDMSLINANSSTWDTAYTNLVNNSASYLTGSGANLGNIPILSASWTEAYTNLVYNSTAYLSAYDMSLINANSSTWDTAYTNLVNNSATWVVGSASSTDNAIARYDSTTGKLLQNSLVTINDLGAIIAPEAGSVIPFYFSNQAAFPGANTAHGAVAHSHSDGKMYFSHGGSWIALANASDIAAFLPLAGGNISGDLTIAGSLTAHGNFTVLDTLVTVTSALSVLNTGTGPALVVRQTGSQPIAQFYDNESGPALYIANDGKVGIGSETPDTNLFVTGTTYVEQIKEKVTLSASQANSTVNFDIRTQSVLFLTLSSTGNWTVNFRADASNSLNNIMSVGQSFTCVAIVSTGTTTYYNSAVQIDGSTYVPYYLNGLAPQAVISSHNSIQNYAYTIIKRGNAVFNVLASVNEYY